MLRARGALGGEDLGAGPVARGSAAAGDGVGGDERRGGRSLGGNKRVRYFTALGSAREVEAALRVAAAFGYVGPIEEGSRGISIAWRRRSGG